MSTIDIDVSDLYKTAADLQAGAKDLMPKIRPVISKGALNIKKKMAADFAGSRHFGQVARVVTYDMLGGSDFVEAQIGPETGGRVVGDLAHIAYFGGANGGGGTVPDPEVHLRAEEPVIERYVSEILEALL